MSTKKTYKSKKKLQTSLGQAPKEYDLSHVQKPIETSVCGLTQAIKLLDTATEEVRRYISYECELIYECRVCRTIFRSLANFIYHKREFCKESATNFAENCSNIDQIPPSHNNKVPTNIQEPVVIENSLGKPKWKCSRLGGPEKKLSLIISKLGKQKNLNIPDVEEGEENKGVQKNADITLEQISGNVSGVFQTLMKHIPEQNDVDELMMNEVMEIHSILNDDEAILGIDGKAIEKAPTQSELTCDICNQVFSTKKTLTHHTKYKHNNTKLVYLCPLNGCKGNVFANTWSVFRHLFKIHRKSTLQVRRLRAQIQATVFKQEDDGVTNNVIQEETVDPRLCLVCGKRFERKAALVAHSKYCTVEPEVIESPPSKPVSPNKRKQILTNRNIEESVILVDEGSGNSMEGIEVISEEDDGNEMDDEELSIVSLSEKADPYMSINELRCIPCGTTFRNRRRLLKHMCAHFNWFHYQCSICWFKTYDQKSCMEHVGKEHPLQKLRYPVISLPYLEIVRNSSKFQKVVDLEETDGSDNEVKVSSGVEQSEMLDEKDRSEQQMIMEVIFGKLEGDVTVDLGSRVRRSVKLNNRDFVYGDNRKRTNGRVFNSRRK